MPRLVKTLCFAASITALLTPLTAADSSAGDESVQNELEQMRRQMQQLREENQAMRSDLDTLRAQVDDDWITTQRSEEIRQIVYDTLADADTRASLLDDGMTAGWADGFFLASSDGRFRMNIAGQMQIRWIYNYHDQVDRHRQGFENTRTKLTFSGHVFSRDLQYLVRTDVTRNEPGLVNGLDFLQDAWVRFLLDEHMSVRVGQFKTPFSREELVSSAYQLAVERSLVNESLNIGRSQGVEFVWADDVRRLSVMVSDGGEDNLGGFTAAGGGVATGVQAVGDPINNRALLEDVEWALQGRYEHIIAGTREQFEDFTSPIGEPFAAMVGVGGHAQKTESDGATTFMRDEIRWLAATADVSLEFGGANAFASTTYHYVDRGGNIGQFHFWGVVVQGGYYITPKWEFFARGEWGQVDSERALLNDVEDLIVLTLGANYYFEGHDAKWTTDIGFGINEVTDRWDFDIAGYRADAPDAAPQIVFRTQFQLLF